MIDIILNILHYLISFVLVISVIVFVHEFGHYFVARCCGVKATDFSIGFGKALCSWQDSRGTNWKICAIPMGGYVKFLGDLDPTSATTDVAKVAKDEQRYMFHNKPLWQKAAIVAAGPGANFVFSIIVLTWFFFNFGIFTGTNVISKVLANSPAQKVGLQAGDMVEAINGESMKDFFQIERVISMNPGIALDLTIKREQKYLQIKITPQIVEVETGFDRKVKVGKIGVQSSEVVHQDVALPRAVKESVVETIEICKLTLRAIGQMFVGERSYKEVEGPIGIAKLAGESAKKGTIHILWLMALLSINLGLINLLPIPLLDGGHLLFYVIETIVGKKRVVSIQKIAIIIGFVIVVSLSLLAIFNDLVNIKLF